MKKTLLRLGGLLILAGGYYFLTQGPSRDNIAFAGNYQPYETASGTINSDIITVLDFYAPRCPSCRAAHTNILSKANEIPSNIQILNVDYDSNTALRTKYGVTSQHTFVLIDKEGNLIKKTQGLNHVSEIVAFVGDYLPITITNESIMLTGDTAMSGTIEISSTSNEDAIVSQEPKSKQQSAGIYTDYELGKKYISDPTKKVVLFFHASRCPSCRQAEKDIQSNIDNIDSNLVILKVDYDSSSDLKQQYGITTQTSYVLINNDRSLNKKSVGMTSLQAIEEFVK